MAHYVDGFVLPIKKSKLAVYKKMAAEGSKMWMGFGALHYVEAISNDMRSPFGTLPFPKLAKAKPDEVVVFAYVEYKSRAHRDAVNKKINAGMAEAQKQHKAWEMPFDMKRMAYGGFQMIVEK